MDIFNQLFGRKAPTCQHKEPPDPLDLEREVTEVIHVNMICWECGRLYTERLMASQDRETYTDKVWKHFDAETNPTRRKVYTEFLALKPDHITGRDYAELGEQLYTATNSMEVQ